MCTDTDRKHDELMKIGQSAMSCIKDMVNALECDYERLAELKDSKENFDPSQWINEDDGTILNTFELVYPDDAEELTELESQAGECTSREDAEQRISEDPLSVAVRSGWASSKEDFEPEEFCILLSTGGPAVRILGELDANNEPHRAWLQVQDWGTPWTDYYEPDTSDVLLTYARQFCYGP